MGNAKKGRAKGKVKSNKAMVTKAVQKQMEEEKSPAFGGTFPNLLISSRHTGAGFLL